MSAATMIVLRFKKFTSLGYVGLDDSASAQFFLQRLKKQWNLCRDV